MLPSVLSYLACVIEAAPPATLVDTAEQGDSGCLPQVWYLDADGDGHGAPDQTYEACEAPPSYVAIGDDCAADDAAVVDTCWPLGTVGLASSPLRLGESAGPLSVANLSESDLDGAGGADLVVFGEAADDSSIGRTAWLVSRSQRGALALDDAAALTIDDPGENVSSPYQVAEGDFDGDGVADLMADAHELATLFGPMTAASRLDQAIVSGDCWLPAAVHDGNDNGRDELVVANSPSTSGSVDAYVLDGIDPGSSDIESVAVAAWRVSTVWDVTVVHVATGGDLDGDGLDDVAVAASIAGAEVDALFIGLGPATEAGSWTDGDDVTGIGGEQISALAFAPDINGDGLADLVTGQSEADSADALRVGSVRFWTEFRSGGNYPTWQDLVVGSEAHDVLGAEVVAGDIDGDANTDLVATARNNEVAIFFGPFGEGTLELTQADTLLGRDPDATFPQVTGLDLAPSETGAGSDLLVSSWSFAWLFLGAPR